MRRGFSIDITENVQAEVKWFNPTKGFGFVATPDGDAFLHISSIDSDIDPKTLGEGTVLLVDLSEGHKGKQVSRVIRLVGQSQTSKPIGERHSRGYHGDAVVGTVKWFNRDRGYGFISLDTGGKDVFVSMQTIERSGLDGLREAQRVRFVSVQRDKGPVAEKVEILP